MWRTLLLGAFFLLHGTHLVAEEYTTTEQIVIHNQGWIKRFENYSKDPDALPFLKQFATNEPAESLEQAGKLISKYASDVSNNSRIEMDGWYIYSLFDTDNKNPGLLIFRKPLFYIQSGYAIKKGTRIIIYFDGC